MRPLGRAVQLRHRGSLAPAAPVATGVSAGPCGPGNGDDCIRGARAITGRRQAKRGKLPRPAIRSLVLDPLGAIEVPQLSSLKPVATAELILHTAALTGRRVQRMPR